MKVLKKHQEEHKAFVLTLPISVCDRLDNIAQDSGTSRAAIIRAILEKSLESKDFTISVK